MDIETLRSYCLSLPGATEDIQWGNDLLFRIGGKIFAGASLDPSSPNRFSFKCTPERFGELIEIEGIVPAPYVARYHWVSIQKSEALNQPEIKRLIKQSYQLVYDKLPRKVKQRLS